MRPITSRHNPDVRAFRELAGTADAEGVRVLLDGVHLVRDARTASLPFERVVVGQAHLERDTEEGRLAHELDEAGVDVIVASDQVLAAVSPVKSPSGIVAIACRRPQNAASICADPSPLVVCAVDVQDPGNVGAIVRVAEAGGATGVIVCGQSANPFSWKALRGSMGSTLRVPTAGGIATGEALRWMRQAGLRTVATSPYNGVDPDRADWTGGVGILFGGEGPGLDRAVIDACDARVTIPMAGRVESLNVAVAAAILVYAARRQRA